MNTCWFVASQLRISSHKLLRTAPLREPFPFKFSEVTLAIISSRNNQCESSHADWFLVHEEHADFIRSRGAVLSEAYFPPRYWVHPKTWQWTLQAKEKDYWVDKCLEACRLQLELGFGFCRRTQDSDFRFRPLYISCRFLTADLVFSVELLYSFVLLVNVSGLSLKRSAITRVQTRSVFRCVTSTVFFRTSIQLLGSNWWVHQ